ILAVEIPRHVKCTINRMRNPAIALALVSTAVGMAAVPRTEIRLGTQMGLEENRGQARADIRYILRSGVYTTNTGFVLAPHQVGVDFAGGNPTPALGSIDPLPGSVNVVKGNTADKWITGI